MEETFGLQELLKIVKKYLFLFLLLGIIGGGGSGAVTHFFVTPLYQASTQLVVGRPNTEHGITSTEISGNIQLINTFNQIIVSPRILEQVIDTLGLEESAEQLKEHIDARNASNSQVMVLTVLHENPERAKDIANLTAEVFSEEIADIMNFDNVIVLAPALTPTSPVSPNIIMNVVLGFTGGVITGILLAFLFVFLDQTVKTEGELAALTALPILGSIQTIRKKDMKS